MPVVTDQYDQLKIDKLKHYLEAQAAKGLPVAYEIFVDNLRVISKTDDPKEFDSYEYYMNEDTEKVRILIYSFGLSPRNDQYCFMVQKTVGGKSLNGVQGMEAIMEEKLAAREREYEMNRLREELQTVREELAETEAYADKLEKDIQNLKENKFKLGSMDLPAFVGEVVGSWVKKNPQVLARLPIAGEALAGLIQSDGATNSQLITTGNESNASFQKETTNGLSEEERRDLTYLQGVKEKLTEEQREGYNLVLHAMIQEPQLIAIILDLITTKNNSQHEKLHLQSSS